MNAAPKLAGFAAALGLLFAGGAAAGGAIDPDRSTGEPAHGSAHPADRAEKSHPMNTSPSTTHAAGADRDAGAHPVRGLAVAESGLRVAVHDPELRRGVSETLRFRVVGEDGATVRDFDVEHEKRMHLIVARRDLTGFQHLHPAQRPDGSWQVDLRLDTAGSYRLFADFARQEDSYTLASDLRVDGTADLQPLPDPRPTARTDGGLDVRLTSGRVGPGRAAELGFTVTKDGAPVNTEPYLGAGGHLVALREGDLAFLHVHPIEHGQGDQPAGKAHDDGIGFAATFPTEGRYRLFLQIKHNGRIHTAAFTQEVR